MSSVFDQRRAALAAAALLALAGCGNGSAEADETRKLSEPEGAEQLSVQVLEEFPHDPESFTQGLELRDGVMYESAGLYGQSDVRLTDPGTGEVLESVDLPDDEFAEGLTLTDEAVWQLTWQEHIAYQRDPDTLEVLDSVSYDGEGWGLCYDGEGLVMSDGTSTLTFRDPETFEPRGTVEVVLDGEPLAMLNELECVDGQVWANVWQTDRIVRIDPGSGEVTAVVDAAGLLPEEDADGADVLNGIAAAEQDGAFYLTGKLWPTMFLVSFVPASQ